MLEKNALIKKIEPITIKLNKSKEKECYLFKTAKTQGIITPFLRNGQASMEGIKNIVETLKHQS